MTSASAARTLDALLAQRAEESPDALLHTYLLDGERSERDLSRAEVAQRALHIAARLHSLCRPGDRALLLFPPAPEFILALHGCFRAGVIAVPAYPPDPTRLARTLPRLQRIADDASVSVVLTLAAVRDAAPALLAEAPSLTSLPWIAVDDLECEEGMLPFPARGEDDAALLQYTSGSTGEPKGVVLTHRNVITNLARLVEAFEGGDESIEVLWLPLYHDLGLIGGVLGPLYSRARSVLLSPLDFLRRPARWLEAIDRHRGTISGAPNFAYDLCVRKSTEEERSRLDLRSWRSACVAAEPIQAATLARFASAFAVAGFDPRAFYPCYGLAEATLIATGGRQDELPQLLRVDARRLEDGFAEPAGEAATHARTLVGCGTPFGGDRVLIVDPATQKPVGDSRVGEIWFHGEGVAQGYWRRPDATRELFAARVAGVDVDFLRTGDLGFVRDGELFVTGRAKDLLIVRGRNLHPQDVESSAERSHPSLRPGCSAAFSLELDGREGFGIALEVDPRRAPDLEQVADAVRREILADHDVLPDTLVLLGPGGVPKTSSGKVQRFACRDEHRSGRLPALWSTPRGVGPAPPAPDSDARPTLESVSALIRSLLAGELGVALQAADLRRSAADLGIDSLVATVVAGEIEARFGVELDGAALLDARDLSALCQEVAQRGRSRPPPEQAPAPAVSSEADGPLSIGQRGLWFLREANRGRSAYDLSRVFRVRGPLDLDALRRALRAIVDRHASLRAAIVVRDGEPRLKVHGSVADPLHVHDASGWDAPRLEQAVASCARQPLALDELPSLRLDVFVGAGDAIAVVRTHHLAIDLWSAGQLLAELEQGYAATGTGSAPMQRREVADPIAFARWQQALLDGPAGAELARFWRDALADTPTLIDLPSDRTLPESPGEEGDALAFEIPEGLGARLVALAREHGCTTASLLLAAFQTLLWRWTGQDRFVVGVAAAGRARGEWRSLVGYLVNLLPVACDLSDDPPFAAHLARSRERLARAIAHQDFPFARIVETVSAPRVAGRSPLVQVAYSFESRSAVGREGWGPLLFGGQGARAGFADLELEAAAEGERRVPFELTLRVAPSRGTFLCAFEHRSALFDSPSIAALRDAFVRLLEGCVATPHASASRIPLLSEREVERAWIDWNSTQRLYPADESLAQLFARQVARDPEAIALIDGDRRWSYRELDRRARRLAQRLRANGLAPGERVAVLSDRSAELVAGIVAVLQAGASYVPLDVDDAAPRLAHIVGESAARAVLAAAPAALSRCRDWGHPIVVLDGDGEDPAADAPLGDAASGGSPAYVMYTSGSTGQPKGIEVPHRAVSRLVTATDYVEIGVSDRIAFASSPAFDASTFEIWGALLNGAALVVVPKDVVLSPRRLRQALVRDRITILLLTTSVFHWLVSESPELFGSLRYLLVGGERLDPEAVRTLFASAPSPVLIQVYGPTEATVFTTTERVLKVPANARSIPIGRPIANTRAFVLDRHLQPLPPGFRGELCIAGDGLAIGYLGQPELTASSFVRSEASPRRGERLLRSGDRARWLPDGRIVFDGRMDEQLKIRGHRVEPAEVEAAALTLAGVGEAAALGVSGTHPHVELHWSSARSEPGAADEAALRRHLEEKLPSYLRPARFVHWPVLPRTPGGKLDRGALARVGARPNANESAGGAGSPAEALLAGIFASVLALDSIDLHEDFFASGGDSLAAARAAARISERTGREIDVRFLLRFPTVAAAAAALDALDPGDPARARPVRGAAWPERRSDLVHVEERPLLDLFALGRLAPVAAAALATLPASLAAALGSEAKGLAERFLMGMPRVVGVDDVEGGRIAIIVLPCFDGDVYRERAAVREWTDAALHLAGSLGARVVSLTGLLASATDYGRDVQAVAGSAARPVVSTGHAATAAAIALNLESLLERVGRRLASERLGFLGLGSVGEAALRLILEVLPHPTELLLCDVYGQAERIESLARSLRRDGGFAGRIRTLGSRAEPPPEFFDASVIVAATNAPEVLPIEALRPGTLVADDSGPHCFRVESAIRRFERAGDILFSEAGAVRVREPIRRVRHLPPELASMLGSLARTFYQPEDDRAITGCILSSLLSSQEPALAATIGPTPPRADCRRHFDVMSARGITGAEIACLGWSPDREAVLRFRARFGGAP